MPPVEPVGSAPSWASDRPLASTPEPTAAVVEREARPDRGGRGGRGSRDSRRGEGRGEPRPERSERAGRSETAERGERTEGRDSREPRARRPEQRDEGAVAESSAPREERAQRTDALAPAESREERDGQGVRRGPRSEREGRRPSASEAVAGTEVPLTVADGVADSELLDSAGGEVRDGARKRRRGGRGGRDRDDSRSSGTPEVGSPAAAAADSTTPADDDASQGIGTTADFPPPLPDVDAEPQRDASGNEPAERGARGDGRRRGSRGRSRREEGSTAGEPASELAQTEAPVSAQREMPPVEPVGSAPSWASDRPLASTPEPTAAVVETKPTSTGSIADAPAAEPTALPAANGADYVLPTDRLQAVAASAGLEWVGSDAEKIRQVRESLANEPKPVHVPREPKALSRADEGPLVLVETRKDLSEVKLPFEA